MSILGASDESLVHLDLNVKIESTTYRINDKTSDVYLAPGE